MSSDPETTAPGLIGDDASVELSSNRTSLSFERTRMSADRTLMSSVRTSISLITFGFTIYETFHQLHKQPAFATGDHAARIFGLSLIVLGIVLLAMGISGHMRFERQLTDRRGRLHRMGLLRTAVEYRATPTLVVAMLMLLIGVAAASYIVLRIVR